MAFGEFANDGLKKPMADINMIPLIDVMLVLLVIFLITAPLFTHAVKVELPKASSAPNITQPDNVQVVVRESGELLWNGEPVSRAILDQRLQERAAATPQPELHIRADRLTPYENVARVMADAARAGVIRIGFVTEPEADRRAP